MYRKHISTRASGWDHLECETCSRLKREVALCENVANHATVPVEKDKAELDQKLATAQLDQHRERAIMSKNSYYARRAKAVANRDKGDLSLIEDGAGAQASNYCPRYSTTEKGEPQRYAMLKIKSTYIKVRVTILLNL